jgi:hypothetical protein
MVIRVGTFMENGNLPDSDGRKETTNSSTCSGDSCQSDAELGADRMPTGKTPSA